MDLVLHRMESDNYVYKMAEKSWSSDIIVPLKDDQGRNVVVQFQLKNTLEEPSLDEEVEKARALTAKHPNARNILMVLWSGLKEVRNPFPNLFHLHRSS